MPEKPSAGQPADNSREELKRDAEIEAALDEVIGRILHDVREERES
jgi:hypothetical protein